LAEKARGKLKKNDDAGHVEDQTLIREKRRKNNRKSMNGKAMERNIRLFGSKGTSISPNKGMTIPWVRKQKKKKKCAKRAKGGELSFPREPGGRENGKRPDRGYVPPSRTSRVCF